MKYVLNLSLMGILILGGLLVTDVYKQLLFFSLSMGLFISIIGELTKRKPQGLNGKNCLTFALVLISLGVGLSFIFEHPTFIWVSENKIVFFPVSIIAIGFGGVFLGEAINLLSKSESG